MFETAVTRWIAGLGGIRHVGRPELVAAQLAEVLGARPARVRDAGWGPGSQALRLAVRGTR